MIEPTAVDRYLDAVSVRLRMPDALRDEVLEELAAHLTDATADEVAMGVPLEIAEQRAVERLGPADPLADRLRRTHATKRRLLAAVGNGLMPAARDTVGGLFVGMVIAVVAAAALAALTRVAFGLLDRPAPTWGEGRAVFTSVYALVAFLAVSWGTATFVRTVAARSVRDPAAVWAPIGLAAAAVTATIAWTARLPHDGISVALYGVLPLAALASAYATAHPSAWRPLRRVAPRREWIARLALVMLVGVLSAMLVAAVGQALAPRFMASLTPPTDAYVSASADPDVTAVATERRERARVPVISDGWGYAGEPVVVLFQLGEAHWSRYQDLQVEAWRAVGPDLGHGGTGALDPDLSAPLLIEPVADPRTDHIVLALDRYRDVGTYALFLVGTERSTGDRVIIGEPAVSESTYYGTLIHWLLVAR